MTRAFLFALGFAAGCAMAATHEPHDDSELRGRVEALEGRIGELEKRAEIWTNPHLLQWIKDDPRLRDLGAVVQRLQWAHPEIEEWGPLQ